MGATWVHTQLGRFEYDGIAWTTLTHMPAFGAFTYDAGEGGDGGREGQYRLAFTAQYETDLPSEAAIALALKVLANQSKLVRAVTKAMWDDFNGRGPDSGMWWHGDRQQVAERLDAEQSPKRRGDLLALMQVSGVLVRKGVYNYDGPVVEIDFEAAFEPEHGVGVLTDGKTILGTGYSVDVTAFTRTWSSGRRR